MNKITVVEVASFRDAVVGEYDTWDEAYAAQETFQEDSLRKGFDLNELRYAVRSDR